MHSVAGEGVLAVVSQHTCTWWRIHTTPDLAGGKQMFLPVSPSLELSAVTSLGNIILDVFHASVSVAKFFSLIFIMNTSQLGKLRAMSFLQLLYGI